MSSVSKGHHRSIKTEFKIGHKPWNKNGKNCLMRKSIKCIETGEIYSSIAEASRQLCISTASIKRVLRGLYKQACGLSWEYVDKEIQNV